MNSGETGDFLDLPENNHGEALPPHAGSSAITSQITKGIRFPLALALGVSLANLGCGAAVIQPRNEDAGVQSEWPIQKELRERYGLRIFYSVLPLDKGEYVMDLPKEEAASEATENLQEELGKYPRNMDNMFPRGQGKFYNIYLVTNLVNPQGKKINGAVRVSGIMIDTDIAVEVGNTFNHEFFHFKDKESEGLGENGHDNPIWAEVNQNGMKDYLLQTSADAVNSGYNLEPQVTGFQRMYGHVGGPDEDQATIAQALFQPQLKNSLLRRCTYDTVLRKKVEMLTACEFDPEAEKFTRMFTETEYSTRFGFEGYQYYAKWSKGLDKKPQMGLAYWNTGVDIWRVLPK